MSCGAVSCDFYSILFILTMSFEQILAAKNDLNATKQTWDIFICSPRQEVPLFACTCISFFLLGKNTQKSCVEQTSC